MPRQMAAFLLSIVVAASASAETAVMPTNLVGVWTTDGSVLKGALLSEGQALYLGADGIGAFVGGPPPIGFKIVAVFDAQRNVLEFDVYEGTRRGPHSSISYDPVTNTFESGGSKHLPMHRRLEAFTEETKRALGL